MNGHNLFLIALCIFMIVGFYLGYQKIRVLESRLSQVEVYSSIDEKHLSKKTNTEENVLALSERCNEINELKKLGKHISSLQVTATFINNCLKKIEGEIAIQEYIYFRELGEETYNNSCREKTVS